MPKPPTHIRLSRISEPVIVTDGTAWFSQRQIAEVFQKAVQTANEHITAVREAKAGAWKVLRVAQTEGTRRVVRNKLHYRLDFVYAVGVKAREYVITNEVLDECRALGIVTTDLPVIPVKEREFREMVTAAFDGICAFEYQFEVDRYRLDLFCRELCIAVEYDEKHHTKPENIAADRLRAGKTAISTRSWFAGNHAFGVVLPGERGDREGLPGSRRRRPAETGCRNAAGIDRAEGRMPAANGEDAKKR